MSCAHTLVPLKNAQIGSVVHFTVSCHPDMQWLVVARGKRNKHKGVFMMPTPELRNPRTMGREMGFQPYSGISVFVVTP